MIKKVSSIIGRRNVHMLSDHGLAAAADKKQV
jgi:hypothetical protein